jgi:tetratricopeptide (TPR) repeat protein
LLGVFRNDGPGSAALAYLLTVRAELGERAAGPRGSPATAAALDGAIADYRRALELRPGDDSIRASLVDALVTRGDLDGAREAARIERPGLALLVRQAALAVGADRARLRAQAEGLLALEAARGDARHAREAAMLAVADGDYERALGYARANFATQRELADVRVFARAAAAMRSAGDLRTLREWLARTGFADAVTEDFLATAARG